MCTPGTAGEWTLSPKDTHQAADYSPPGIVGTAAACRRCSRRRGPYRETAGQGFSFLIRCRTKPSLPATADCSGTPAGNAVWLRPQRCHNRWKGRRGEPTPQAAGLAAACVPRAKPSMQPIHRVRDARLNGVSPSHNAASRRDIPAIGACGPSCQGRRRAVSASEGPGTADQVPEKQFSRCARGRRTRSTLARSPIPGNGLPADIHG